MKLISALALALFFAAATFARADTPTVSGFWEAKDDDGFTTAWFLFSEKDGVYSARLVKGFRKAGDTSKLETICHKCPGEKKDARIMGLTLFYGMKRDGLHYDDGSVLDPRDGSVYHALMNLSEDGKELEVRGYLGIKMLGKSQTWLRLPDDAMKKEDIPKEIYADGSSPSDTAATADKPKHGDATHAAGDKPKAHKKAKADKKPKTEVAEPDAAATPEPTQ
ncbi:MAG: DUF2147 domain-containing protein [Pseudomonadota bacterium]|nr:DUF2147 domain-containing protein [Pseudomonadota bacterium]